MRRGFPEHLRDRAKPENSFILRYLGLGERVGFEPNQIIINL
jgi:hypothetical protein